MIAELPPLAGAGQRWPCGPECRYARTLPGTYGEWFWCEHPWVGGCLVHAGHDCASYDPTPKTPPVHTEVVALN
jgi:hypothetical protein